MSIPSANRAPAFNITRTSHVVLSSRDLEATREFYEVALGFDTVEQSKDTLYIRGLEEACHHSLVFKKGGPERRCHRVGFRVNADEDLDCAADYFRQNGLEPSFVDTPFQGKTLQVTDDLGVPLEFCVSMQPEPSRLQEFHRHRGGKPMHLDHVQIVTHDVDEATRRYTDMGFGLSEYTATDGKDELWGVWLRRKNTTQDVVFANGKGPRLHHMGFYVNDVMSVIGAADAAASLGYAASIERGPGRHGIGNALFIYFRDPDGHRLELFTSHYLALDSEFPPRRWDLSDTRRSQLWGLPATSRWFSEATEFEGSAISEPRRAASPVTLETFLQGD